jgi:hypothetical protein
MPDFSDILLTVDFDRTLTAPDSSIPARNIEAIRYFMDHGGTFTVNTGRSVPMTAAFRDKVPVNAPLLLYNGSAAYDPAEGKLSFCHEIHMDMWQTVAKCMALFPDLTVEVQGVDAHYRFTETPAWDAFCDHQPCARGFAQPGDDLGPFLKFTLYGKITDVTVAHLFDGTPEEIARIDVLYGPFSAAYPGNSIGAVVNITTRLPDDLEATATAGVSVQTYDLYGRRDTYPAYQAGLTIGDRFGPLAAHGAEGISETAAQNRAYLCRLMLGAGFVPYSAEWWHYTLKDEPYPDTYFDFIVK